MRDKVLVVEDELLNREMMTQILQEEYSVTAVGDGSEAISVLEREHNRLAVILLDLVLPKVDGFEVLRVMQERKWIHKIPVLIISGRDDVKSEQRCFEYGASDFVRKPFNASLVKQRVKNIVKLFQYQNQLEQTVEKQTETMRKQYRLLQLQAEKLHQTNERIIDILGTVVEYRSLENGDHIRRVKAFTEILARQVMKEYPEYGLTDARIKSIVAASALHDIGKISIPDHLLLKPGRLTPKEYDYMHSHAARGSEIIENIKDIWDEDYQQLSYDICRHHHERYDGNGYPDGLVGEEIPISAQIVSIVDVYDALISERVYKNAYPKDESFQMIVMGECGVFSPKLLECFRNVREQLEETADRFDQEALARQAEGEPQRKQ